MDEISQIEEDADSWINFQKQKSKIDEDDQDSMDRLWVVIRNTCVGDSENHFELQGGERIKVGRVVLTVKELCNDKVSYCAQDSQLARMRDCLGTSTSHASVNEFDKEIAN